MISFYSKRKGRTIFLSKEELFRRREKYFLRQMNKEIQPQNVESKETQTHIVEDKQTQTEQVKLW